MHRRANTAIGIIIIALAAVSAIAAIISVVLQYNENHAAYERTIQESCQARGYDTATFSNSQPNCCRKDACFPYETVMRYGPGYEPTPGALHNDTVTIPRRAALSARHLNHPATIYCTGILVSERTAGGMLCCCAFLRWTVRADAGWFS